MCGTVSGGFPCSDCTGGASSGGEVRCHTERDGRESVSDAGKGTVSYTHLAGGENVYAGTDQEFLTVNTEDMKTKEPDVILRAAHALPDQIVEMFNEEFATDDIWQHFDAVKNGRVYDLTYEYFGMSANFNYPEALEAVSYTHLG